MQTQPICVFAVKLTGTSRATPQAMIRTDEIETMKAGNATFIRFESHKRLLEE